MKAKYAHLIKTGKPCKSRPDRDHAKASVVLANALLKANRTWINAKNRLINTDTLGAGPALCQRAWHAELRHLGARTRAASASQYALDDFLGTSRSTRLESKWGGLRTDILVVRPMYSYLTTTGRVTGQPREIEICSLNMRALLLVGERREHANWGTRSSRSGRSGSGSRRR